MGSKYKPERNDNPGPGQYNADANKNKKSAPNTKLAKADRQDLWDAETKDDRPGPGQYVDETNTFGKAAKGANMGSKYKAEVNQNPGPGQYTVNDDVTKTGSSNQRMPKAKRQEIWESQTKNDVPGPGNYSENTSSFAHIKGGAAGMGSKYRPEVNQNPGPGQYNQALYDMSNH